MGKQDTQMKQYMGNNRRFANLINTSVFKGKKKLQKEYLEERDTTELSVILEGDEVLPYTQKYQDIMKEAIIKENDHMISILIGLENQTYIDYLMPLRVLNYAVLNYNKQIREKEKKKYKDTNEFLSGVSKDTKVKPVLMVVLSWVQGPWDGPTSLKELYDVSDEEILEILPDFKMVMISPYDMSEEELDKYDEDLGKVLRFIKRCGEAKEGKEVLRDSDIEYTKVDRENALLLRELTGKEFEIEENQEEINMLESMKRLFEVEKMKGKEEGKLEGIIEGEEKGRTEEALNNIRSLMNTLNLTMDEAMNALQVSEGKREYYREKLVN